MVIYAKVPRFETWLVLYLKKYTKTWHSIKSWQVLQTPLSELEEKKPACN